LDEKTRGQSVIVKNSIGLSKLQNIPIQAPISPRNRDLKQQSPPAENHTTFENSSQQPVYSVSTGTMAVKAPEHFNANNTLLPAKAIDNFANRGFSIKNLAENSADILSVSEN